MEFIKMKTKNGFTIVELLIVILIIGILTSAVLSVVNPSGLQSRTRDSNRLAELNQLASVIETYTVSEGGTPQASDITDSSSTFRTHYLRVWPEGVNDRGEPSDEFEFRYHRVDNDNFILVVLNSTGENCYKYNTTWGQVRDCVACNFDPACENPTSEPGPTPEPGGCRSHSDCSNSCLSIQSPACFTDGSCRCANRCEDGRCPDRNQQCIGGLCVE